MIIMINVFCWRSCGWERRHIGGLVIFSTIPHRSLRNRKTWRTTPGILCRFASKIIILFTIVSNYDYFYFIFFIIYFSCSLNSFTGDFSFFSGGFQYMKLFIYPCFTFLIFLLLFFFFLSSSSEESYSLITSKSFMFLPFFFFFFILLFLNVPFFNPDSI